MSTQKVFEFAKEIGIETIALMDKIREWQLPVKSHMATLDDDMMEEIKNRLDEETKAPATKKKATSKKAASKKVAKKKTATKKTVAKKAVTKKASSTTSSSTTKKTTRKKAGAVIRRKAGEVEAKAQEAMERVQEEAADIVSPAAEMEAQEPTQTLAPDAPVAASEEREAEASAPREEARPERKPKNIVGRMDLGRVAKISGDSSGSRDQGGGSPRVARTSTRNIRTGFFTSEPSIPQVQEEADRFEKKKERDKKKPSTTPKEGEEVSFTATEFRKREVIFQPKKKKPAVRGESKKTQLTTPAAHKRVVKVPGQMSLNDLAMAVGVKAPQLMKKLMQEGVAASMNSTLDFDTIALIVPEFGWEAQNVQKTEDDILKDAIFGKLDAEPIKRPPVVTVMGHVDHGKTSLLDAIRSAKVAAGEAGGITQHIGAYSVRFDSGEAITFIDTPGHEAFTAMRARGAQVTDIAIIVVAADDGMMPQTEEAINHAKAAGVPIIVAINKMDKAGANPDRVKNQLMELELVPEEYGGTTIYCPVSAINGDGVENLLEQINLVAEVQDLKANPGRSAKGVVIESRMEKGRGSVATLLVQDGTLKVGDTLAAGVVVGRIRSMSDDKGEQIKEVLPGYPAEVLGLPTPPMAGDLFDVVKDEKAAEELANFRRSKIEQAETPHAKMSLEQLFSKVKSGDVKELSLVLKTDVAGSMEAIKEMLPKIGNEEVKVKVIHSAVGGVTESDVLLASTANGLIIGFNVRPDSGATRMAKEKGVEIKTYSIIYELMDDLKKALSGLLTPDVVEKAQGSAEVRETFSVPKIGMIAGCFVTDGKINRNDMLRLVRDGKVIYEGKVSSLKRFKDDVKEVATGFECGIGIENFNDIKVGDVIEAFVKEEVQREL